MQLEANFILDSTILTSSLLKLSGTREGIPVPENAEIEYEGQLPAAFDTLTISSEAKLDHDPDDILVELLDADDISVALRSMGDSDSDTVL